MAIYTIQSNTNFIADLQVLWAPGVAKLTGNSDANQNAILSWSGSKMIPNKMVWRFNVTLFILVIILWLCCLKFTNSQKLFTSLLAADKWSTNSNWFHRRCLCHLWCFRVSEIKTNKRKIVGSVRWTWPVGIALLRTNRWPWACDWVGETLGKLVGTRELGYCCGSWWWNISIS